MIAGAWSEFWYTKQSETIWVPWLAETKTALGQKRTSNCIRKRNSRQTNEQRYRHKDGQTDG